jgi:hypothetical protein
MWAVGVLELWTFLSRWPVDERPRVGTGFRARGDLSRSFLGWPRAVETEDDAVAAVANQVGVQPRDRFREWATRSVALMCRQPPPLAKEKDLIGTGPLDQMLRDYAASASLVTGW